MAAFGQAYGAKVFNQLCHTVDLGKEALKLGFFGGEYAFCQALQASA